MNRKIALIFLTIIFISVCFNSGSSEIIEGNKFYFEESGYIVGIELPNDWDILEANQSNILFKHKWGNPYRSNYDFILAGVAPITETREDISLYKLDDKGNATEITISLISSPMQNKEFVLSKINDINWGVVEFYSSEKIFFAENSGSIDAKSRIYATIQDFSLFIFQVSDYIGDKTNAIEMIESILSTFTIAKIL